MKNKNGYILVFTLIVMTVLEMFTLAISTSAIRSFQIQNKSMASLSDQYQVEGELQKIEGSILFASASWISSSTLTLSSALNETGGYLDQAGLKDIPFSIVSAGSPPTSLDSFEFTDLASYLSSKPDNVDVFTITFDDVEHSIGTVKFDIKMNVKLRTFFNDSNNSIEFSTERNGITYTYVISEVDS